MVYHVVRREFWRAAYGGVKFAGTAVVLGLATALATLGIAGARAADMLVAVSAAGVAIGLIAATAAKLGFEATIVRGFDTFRAV